MDFMNRVYGEMIGDWIGKFVSVDVDEEGLAWGKDLRIRVSAKVDQPLLRGVWLKDDDNADGVDQRTDKEKTWFDLKYEKCLTSVLTVGALFTELRAARQKRRKLLNGVNGCELRQGGIPLRSPPLGQRGPQAAGAVGQRGLCKGLEGEVAALFVTCLRNVTCTSHRRSLTRPALVGMM
jgi:hypothetical protein